VQALARAIAHLEQGEWQQAHAIVQQDESELGCWLHGIVHIMEGDLGNAAYWYRKAGRALPREPQAPQEFAAARERMARDSP
jgi:hypothetical protein